MSDEIVFKRISEIGISIRTNGYWYIKDAIRLAVDDPKMLIYISKNLYHELAAKYGITIQAVERTIRYAITQAWEKSRSEGGDFWNKMDEITGGRKPTNLEFLTLYRESPINECPKLDRCARI